MLAFFAATRKHTHRRSVVNSMNITNGSRSTTANHIEKSQPLEQFGRQEISSRSSKHGTEILAASVRTGRYGTSRYPRRSFTACTESNQRSDGRTPSGYEVANAGPVRKPEPNAHEHGPDTCRDNSRRGYRRHQSDSANDCSATRALALSAFSG